MVYGHSHLDSRQASGCGEPYKSQPSINANEFHSIYPGTSSEVESLTHGQLREVYIDLSLVNALSSEVLVHGLLRNTLIIEMRVLSDKETISLSRDGL